MFLGIVTSRHMGVFPRGREGFIPPPAGRKPCLEEKNEKGKEREKKKKKKKKRKNKIFALESLR